jgi:hypothetical protein
MKKLKISTMPLIGFSNRFNEFRGEFTKDTGIENIDDNIDLYIQYVAARFADQNNKLLTNISVELQELYKVMRKV